MKANAAIPSILLCLVAGCASGPPAERPAESGPGYLQIRANTDAYVGRRVSWAGTVLSKVREGEETWIELLLLDPDSRKPVPGPEQVGNRFLARVDGRVSEREYFEGSKVAVAGMVDGRVVGTVARRIYGYPVVKASDHRVIERYDFDPYAQGAGIDTDYHFKRDRFSDDYPPGHYRPGVRRHAGGDLSISH